MHTTNVIERPSDLTVEWLTAAVGAGTVTDFSVERIGTGQMSECYRVVLTYADGNPGPNSVVLKVAATDPVSRQTGLALGLYEREVRFYTEIAPNLGGPIAPCHRAGFDRSTGAFHLLLGDAGPAVQGVTARETFADNGLPLETTLTFNPGGLTASIDIRGHAPVLLTSPDGRVSHFPRAWATVTTADGRTGVGWLEWNRNQQ